MEHSMGHILPEGAHVEAKQGSATVYRVDYPDGWGAPSARWTPSSGRAWCG